MVISSSRLDLIVSYEQPRIKFKADLRMSPAATFVVSSSYKFFEKYDQVYVDRGTTEVTSLYLKAISKNCSRFYRLDLKSLEDIKERLKLGKELRSNELEFMKMEMVHENM